MITAADQDANGPVHPAADPDGEYSLALSNRLRVLPTAGIVLADDWLKSDRFYDSRLRQVHGVSRDHLGGQVLSYSEYDLVGKALRDKTMRQRYAYDAMGRITKVWQRVGTDPELLLSQSRYNALGQLVEKNLHSTNGTSFLQSVDYRHHIRGWLTQVNELVPSAATDITQRNAYVSQVAATIVAADDQYGRPGLALSLELRHTDANANPDLPAPSTLTWELPMLVGDPTSQTFKEYEAFLGQEFTVDFDAPVGPQPDLKTLALAPLQDAWARAGLADAAGVLDKAISAAALDQSHWQATEPGDLFALRLDYELGNGKLKADPRHNGNISAVSWRSAGDGVVRGYGYQYDALGRLTAARYAAHSPGSTKWDAELGRYDVPQISYDQNGNLTQLTQHGWRPGTASFGMIDDLRYSYNGNQLQAVRDQSTQHGDKDFQDNGATSFQDYTYDAQGSMTADANQGITAVTYNHLGLTETVTLTGGRQLRYLYAADGTRLARVRVQPGQADLRDDLVGAFAYQGGALNHILNGEGRVVPAVSPGRQYRHEYHYRDQLGNLRLAFSDLDFDGMAEVSDILQEAHYYPYGLGFSGMAVVSNGVPSRYTFNGKEAQEAFGLQWMDFGARMYDAQVGRWMAVDPLGEQYEAWSTYNFVLGNPVNLIDPDGQRPQKWKREEMWWYRNAMAFQRASGGAMHEDKEGRLHVDFLYGGTSYDVVFERGGRFDQNLTYQESAPSIDARVERWLETNLGGSRNEFGLGDDHPMSVAMQEVGAVVYEANPISAVTELITGKEGPRAKTVVGKNFGYATMFMGAGGITRKVKDVGKVLGISEDLAAKFIPKGFKRTKQFGYQHGEEVFEFKGKFYSRDNTGHNGPAWKVFIQKSGKLKRIGTAGDDLVIFKKYTSFFMEKNKIDASNFESKFNKLLKTRTGRSWVVAKYNLEGLPFRQRVAFLCEQIRLNEDTPVLFRIKFWEQADYLLKTLGCNLSSLTTTLRRPYRNGRQAGVLYLEGKGLTKEFLEYIILLHFHYEHAKSPSLNIHPVIYMNQNGEISIWDLYDDRGAVLFRKPKPIQIGKPAS